MIYEMLDHWSKNRKNKYIWELLGISRDTWYNLKSKKKLTDKHYNIICIELGCKNTTDHYILCKTITKDYYRR